jgi:hypothetical protein
VEVREVLMPGPRPAPSPQPEPPRGPCALAFHLRSPLHGRRACHLCNDSHNTTDFPRQRTPSAHAKQRMADLLHRPTIDSPSPTLRRFAGVAHHPDRVKVPSEAVSDVATARRESGARGRRRSRARGRSRPRPSDPPLTRESRCRRSAPRRLVPVPQARPAPADPGRRPRRSCAAPRREPLASDRGSGSAPAPRSRGAQ